MTKEKKISQLAILNWTASDTESMLCRNALWDCLGEGVAISIGFQRGFETAV